MEFEQEFVEPHLKLTPRGSILGGIQHSHCSAYDELGIKPRGYSRFQQIQLSFMA
jgi:hypothetical protein